MPSRRSALRAGGAALVAALAGCLDDGSAGPTELPPTDATPSDTPTDAPPTDGTPTDTRLVATRVAPSAVPAGATVAPATDTLLETVRAAATTDGRVDHASDGPADPEETLAVGLFEAVRFRGETYDPATEFVPFAGEASYEYTTERVPESEVGSDDAVVRYADLAADERAIADQLVSGDAYGVGLHEDKPDALGVFDAHSHLRTDSGTYAIRTVVGDSAAHHVLRLDPEQPEPGVRVVTLADRAVPEALRGAVTTAVEEGAVAVDAAERDALADLLDGVTHVATVGAVAGLHLQSEG